MFALKLVLKEREHTFSRERDQTLTSVMEYKDSQTRATTFHKCLSLNFVSFKFVYFFVIPFSLSSFFLFSTDHDYELIRFNKNLMSI